MRLRREPPALELDALPREVRSAIEAAITGATITVRRGGRDVGSLEFHGSVLEGEVIAPRLPPPDTVVPDGVTVVATAMRLSGSARRRLADEFGRDYLVLDLHDAPASTDVLLVNPVSPQLLGRLQARFPRAQVIVTEIEDEELGANYAGPVSRLLDAGARAYLPPRDLRGVAENVQAYLAGSRRMELTSAGAAAADVPRLDAMPSTSESVRTPPSVSS